MSDLINVKEIRKERGLTQTQLADECGVTLRTVQNWENGGVIPEVTQRYLSQMATNAASTPTVSLSVKDRIRQFAERKGIPVSRFETMSGLSNGYVSAMRKGLGQEKLNNVLRAFPDLNRDWLLYGEGEMLTPINVDSLGGVGKVKGANTPAVRVVVPTKNKIVLPRRNAYNILRLAGKEQKNLVTAHSDGTVTIERVEETTTPIPIAPIQANIDTGKLSPNENTEPITAENAEVIELIRKEIREEVIEDIREEVKEEIKQEEAIAVIPVEIANQVDVDIKKYIEENESELEKLTPSDLTGDVDGVEKIRKDSMSPTFVAGDRVFIKFLKHKSHIIDGGIYYFNLRNRPTMIRQVKIEGDRLRLIAFNTQYSDIVTSFDNVLRVAEVNGMYRSFFSNQYSETEAVRRKKDEQIDKLIDQNQEALKIIGGLLKK